MSEYRELRDSIWARAWEGGLDSSELLLLLRMVEHMPRVFPNLATLERWTRLDERTIRRALRRLEEGKVIRTLHNPGRGNQYQFLDSDGNPIVIRGIGPRSKRQDTPDMVTGGADMVTGGADMVTGPTPDMVTAEADPDLKQKSNQRMEAGFGARPVPLFKFPKGWKPNRERHLREATELGLTKAEVLERARDCKLKLYQHAFADPDDQFSRELIWAKRDKETKQFQAQRKATNGRFENPGADRATAPPTHQSVFGRIAGG
jgi:DNA-binding transcriptional ArsR family regulator